ncbi:MAG: hypothetical protein ACREB6_05550, partial [Rhodospirillales bacterium]
RRMTGWYTHDEIERIINDGLDRNIPGGRVRLNLPDLTLGKLRVRHLSRKSAMTTLLNQAAGAWDFENRRRYRQPSRHDVTALGVVERASGDLVNILDGRGHGQRHAKASRETLLLLLALAAERKGSDLGPYPVAVPTTWPIEGEDRGITIYGGDDQLRADIDAVRRLNAWARNARGQLRDVRSKPRGGQMDRPTAILMKCIFDVWTVVLGKEMKISESGPLARFVKTCLEPLGVTLSPQAIRERVRDYRNPERPRRRRKSPRPEGGE